MDAKERLMQIVEEKKMNLSKLPIRFGAHQKPGLQLKSQFNRTMRSWKKKVSRSKRVLLTWTMLLRRLGVQVSLSSACWQNMMHWGI